MKKPSLLVGIALLFLQLLAPNVLFGQNFPLKLSSNSRYLVDQDNKPFLINGDTPWLLLINMTLDDVKLYLDDRKNKKINTIQLQLNHYRSVNVANREGNKPFSNINDFSTVNEAYFQFVDKVLIEAKSRGIAVIIAPLWRDCCSEAWRPALNANGVTKSRQFGEFLGNRYSRSKHPNLIAWIMGGDRNLDDTYDEYKALAEGIKVKDPAIFQTYHLGSGNSSRDDISDSWHNLNATYSYFPNHGNKDPHIYDLSKSDYQDSPAMPFFMIESLYEGTNSSFSNHEGNPGQDNAPPFFVRRQAYWSILSGSTGHIYGSKLYFVNSEWKNYLNLPGANDLTHLANLFSDIEWYNLVPDFNNQLTTGGRGTYGNADYVTAALSSDNRLGVAYLPSTGTGTRTLTVNMVKLGSTAICKWFNPNTGVYTTIGTYANSGSRNFTTLGGNGESANDWVLILDARTTTPIVNSYIRLEAESATESAPLVEANDANASGGKFVWNPSGAINNTPVARASYSFTVTEAGTYKIWGRAIATTGGGDSFWVRVDGGSWIKWNQIAGGTATNWTWDDVHNTDNSGQVMSYTLSAGSHTLEIGDREAGTKLDKWLITNDMGYVPSGLEGGSANTYLWKEAESATELSPLVEESDANASGGKYVGYLSGAVNNTAVSRASYSFSVTNAGTYKVWGRAQTPAGGNSFWVRMDGGNWIKWNGITGATATSWGWDDVHDDDNAAQVMTYMLSAGSHTLELSEREAGTKLDKWLITDDLSFTPTGTGGAALRVASGEIVSMEDDFANTGIRLYPNPTTGIVTIELNEQWQQAEVSILDMAGKVYVRKNYQRKKHGSRLSFDLSGKATGVYLLQVRNATRNVSGRIMKAN